MAQHHRMRPLCEHGVDLGLADLCQMRSIARMRALRRRIVNALPQERLRILHHHALEVGRATFGRADVQNDLLCHGADI